MQDIKYYTVIKQPHKIRTWLKILILYTDRILIECRLHLDTNAHLDLFIPGHLHRHLYLSISQMLRFGGDTWFLSGNRWRAGSPQAGGQTKWWAGLRTLGYKWWGVVHHLSTNGRQAAVVWAAEEVDAFCRWFSAVH